MIAGPSSDVGIPHLFIRWLAYDGSAIRCYTLRSGAGGVIALVHPDDVAAVRQWLAVSGAAEHQREL